MGLTWLKINNNNNNNKNNNNKYYDKHALSLLLFSPEVCAQVQ